MITFITVKGESKRCPNKNKILLPFVLEQVYDKLDVVVITDDEELKNIAKQYNVNVFVETKDTQTSELNSIYNYLKVTNQLLIVKEFLHLPVTQPLTSNELINSVISVDITNYDFATTYTYVANRGIFLLNDDDTFKYDSYERKGSLCERVKMVDGCIYKIKTEFLTRVIKSGNTNNYFWNKSKIKFIENYDDFIIDVDTPNDLRKFNKIIKKR